MKIKTIELLEGTINWKIRRVKRLVAEQQFRHYSGHIDIMEMHVPFTHYEHMWRAFDTTDKRTGNKMLFLPGDNLNLDLFGPFFQRSGETSDECNPAREMETLIKILHCAEQVYDHILVMETNHDRRIFKAIYKMAQQKKIAEQIIERIKTTADIFVENKLDKITVVPDILFQIGDAIICHFENNSTIPASVPRKLVKYLIPRMQKHWTVAFQAHTHYQEKLNIMGKHVIETGALSFTQDYWRSGKVRYEEKYSSLGYAVCDMNDGIVDINKCNYVWCEWAGYL